MREPTFRSGRPPKEWKRRSRHKAQVSTDEVYDTLGPEGLFTETTLLLEPSSPYSASKAGADLLARAYFETYGSP